MKWFKELITCNNYNFRKQDYEYKFNNHSSLQNDMDSLKDENNRLLIQLDKLD